LSASWPVGMTVTAFGCHHMLALRCSAIAANLLFIAYGLMLGLVPILILHCLLLPLNLFRLRGCLRDAAHRIR
jgi:CRP/FNR family cyclic AMP-dependent transcriptional regulator